VCRDFILDVEFKMKLKAFSFFHLNLAYSSIEVAQRKDVIERCYWPLLRLARQRHLPFGIEASAWTLESIAGIDPAWIDELRDLVTHGPCEFIGCGYAQLIGPLVPADVNVANIRLGMERYERLLGLRPAVALVNEQAFSAGLVPLYSEAGYNALIMEWNNPARANPNWSSEWRYFPQYAVGVRDTVIPVIWNKSIAFQKVQRYAHGEMELDEYLGYVLSHRGDTERGFPVYGSDVEVFDFRPGRYTTEAPLHAFGEWQRLAAMYAALQAEPDIVMVRPSEVLSLMGKPSAGNRLCLETAAFPIPVKKQDKYNVLRWAVTGRGDLSINTRCWRIFEAMRGIGTASGEDWAELCYLWSSDFRTHITAARWEEYVERLTRFELRWNVADFVPAMPDPPATAKRARKSLLALSPSLSVCRTGRFLVLAGSRYQIKLNCLRGLALESFIDRQVSERVLCGTLHHGYFDDIQWAADYYSGHLVFESPGRAKVTDLSPVEPNVTHIDDGVLISCQIETALGSIEKRWMISETKGYVTLGYRLRWPEVGLGSLRLGYVTLFPEEFEISSLRYLTHNGGCAEETFGLAHSNFDHGTPVSFLVSANQALGVTSGTVKMGDARSLIVLQIEKRRHAAVGMITHRKIKNSHLSRVFFSLQELDDTSRGKRHEELDFTFSLFSQRGDS
jgi:hypothetical protein